MLKVRLWTTVEVERIEFRRRYRHPDRHEVEVLVDQAIGRAFATTWGGESSFPDHRPDFWSVRSWFKRGRRFFRANAGQGFQSYDSPTGTFWLVLQLIETRHYLTPRGILVVTRNCLPDIPGYPEVRERLEELLTVQGALDIQAARELDARLENDAIEQQRAAFDTSRTQLLATLADIYCEVFFADLKEQRTRAAADRAAAVAADHQTAADLVAGSRSVAQAALDSAEALRAHLRAWVPPGQLPKS